MLVDWMLPDMSGLELTRSLKRAKDTEEIPGHHADRARRRTGQGRGAGGRGGRLHHQAVLAARIAGPDSSGVLRRSAPGRCRGMSLRWKASNWDDSSHRVSAGEREIALGPTEYRLLHFFMTHPERVFTRGQLLDRVWGGNTYVEERTVDVHIRRLRKALEPYLLERLVQNRAKVPDTDSRRETRRLR